MTEEEKCKEVIDYGFLDECNQVTEACPVDCMVFNETAYAMVEAMSSELDYTKHDIDVVMTVGDMSDLHIGHLNGKIVCEGGFELT
jgi:hypothetical protein